jgi:heterotetrameric sarcosine oxidase gamma subunit
VAELSISGVPSPASLSALAALYRVGPFGTAGALGVTLGECTGLAMAQISAFRDRETEVAPIVDRLLGLSLPSRPNTAVTSAIARILWIGPSRWLIVASGWTSHELAFELASAIPDDAAAVVDLSAGRSVLSLSGPRTRSVLAKLLPLDLSSKRFPSGSCAQSSIAHIGVLLHAADADTFELFVYRGFARHLWEVLIDASLEFGGVVAKAKNSLKPFARASETTARRKYAALSR